MGSQELAGPQGNLCIQDGFTQGAEKIGISWLLNSQEKSISENDEFHFGQEQKTAALKLRGKKWKRNSKFMIELLI